MGRRGIIPFKTEDHSLRASDGESSLFIRRYYRDNAHLHFLLVHGALEHSGRHMDLVNFWLKNYKDVSITIFDSIGHGRSGGPRAYVSSFKDYVSDLLKVGEFINPLLEPQTKTFICAHSLGGLITLTRILDSAYGWPFPVKGLILSSPCIKPKLLLGKFTDPVLTRLNRFTPKLHLPMIFKGSDLTHDVERANDFDTDSLIPKFMSVRMGKEIIDASHKIRGLSYYLKIPSLFLIAGNDKLVDPESTTLFAHGIDKQTAKVIQYPQHHHELWNETDRQDIFETMRKWVDVQLKETP